MYCFNGRKRRIKVKGELLPDFGGRGGVAGSDNKTPVRRSGKERATVAAFHGAG